MNEKEKLADPIEEQYEKMKAERDAQKSYVKKETKYDIKNYVNTRVTKEEKSKDFKIRILPIEKDSRLAWVEIHNHWDSNTEKSYICTKKSVNLPEGTNKDCPYCEIEQDFWKLYREEKNDVKKAKYKESAKAHSAIKGFALRVIDRDDEDFGPKFLRVSEGVIDSIMNVKKLNKSANIDIFSLTDGRDIILTYEYEAVEGKKGKSKFKSAQGDLMQSPLHKDNEIIQKWINDDKKWSDVYTIKSYDYLTLIISGAEPWFDKPTNKWIDKKELNKQDDANNEEEDVDADNEVEEITNTNSSSVDEGDDLPF